MSKSHVPHLATKFFAAVRALPADEKASPEDAVVWPLLETIRQRCLPPVSVYSSHRITCLLQLVGEERQRLARLRLLVLGRSDPALTEERARLGSDLERLRRRALRRDLEDPVAVGVQPQLDDELAPVRRWRALHLEHEDRAELDEVVEPDALRCVLGVERALLLREELAQRSATRP